VKHPGSRCRWEWFHLKGAKARLWWLACDHHPVYCGGKDWVQIFEQ